MTAHGFSTRGRAAPNARPTSAGIRWRLRKARYAATASAGSEFREPDNTSGSDQAGDAVTLAGARRQREARDIAIASCEAFDPDDASPGKAGDAIAFAGARR